MKKKVIWGVVVVAVIIGGYFTWLVNNNTGCIQVITTAKNTKTGEIKDFPTPCDVPKGWEQVNQTSLPITATNISDWKTYTNEKYGFELKFPPTWGDVEVKNEEFKRNGNFSEILSFNVSELEIFNIEVFTDDKFWKFCEEAQKAMNEDSETASTECDAYFITNNEKNIFMWYLSRDYPYFHNYPYLRFPDEHFPKITEIPKIILTFKFTK